MLVSPCRIFGGVLPAAATLVVAVAPARAQEGRDVGWSDKAELTFVVTGGNASQSTFGLKNALDYVWPEAAFRLGFGGIRTSSKTFTRVAQGTASDFTVSETSTSAVTAEAYFARGRFERNVGDRTFVYLGSGWERNTFAGVGSRVASAVGVGRAFADREAFKLRVDVGATYTLQQDVESAVRDDFLGVRLSVDLFRSLTETTDFSSALVVDENQENTDDLRTDLTNSISVDISEGLALKASHQILFDNDPARKAIPLGTTGTTVLAPLKKVDTAFTLAIVLTF